MAALGDAERALSDYDAGRDALARRQTALDAARRSVGHAEARFAAGDIAGIELLAAERLLHEAETDCSRHPDTARQRAVTGRCDADRVDPGCGCVLKKKKNT